MSWGKTCMSFRQIRCPATLRWKWTGAFFNPVRSHAIRMLFKKETGDRLYHAARSLERCRRDR